MLALGTVALLTGCARGSSGLTAAGTAPAVPPGTSTPPVSSPTARSSRHPSEADALDQPRGADLPGIPPAVPGPPVVLSRAPAPTNRIALTVDDGYDAETVAGYVQFASATGIALTFSPNGVNSRIWDQHATVLRPLVEAGQVQIGNHTYAHLNLLDRTDTQIAGDIEQNEAWVQRTFGTTSRPYLRPPYGFHDERTDAVAGSLGFTSILMWSGTFGDSTLVTPARLLSLAEQWLLPGTVMLGHANHPTVLGLFEEIREIIESRGLAPVTLDTMFATSRATGGGPSDGSGSPALRRDRDRRLRRA